MKISLNNFIGRALSPLNQKSEVQQADASTSQPLGETQVENKTDSVELSPHEAKTDGLLVKAGKAIIDPIIGFAQRTTLETAATAALATAVSIGTMGAVAAFGPIGLLVPAAAGTVAGMASQKAVDKAFKRKKDGRFEALGTGFAVAGMGYGALIGGPTVAGVAALAAGTGAIFGLANSLMVQTMEATGVLNRS